MQLASGTTIRHEPRTPAVTPVQVTKGEKGDPGAPGGSDAATADHVSNGALTKAALSATYATAADMTETARVNRLGDAKMRKSQADAAKAAEDGLLAPALSTSVSVGGQRAIIRLPANFSRRVPLPLVIHYQGLGNDADLSTQWQPMADAALAAGFAVATCDFHGDHYGNPGALADTAAVFDAALDIAPINGVLLSGESMGVIGALNAITHNSVPAVLGAYVVQPVVSLRQRYDNGRATEITAAYGLAAGGSDYATKTAGYDPALLNGSKFRGVPFYIAASPADTQVPKTQHADVLANLLAGYSAPVTQVNASGAHGDASHFDPTAYVAFLRACAVGLVQPVTPYDFTVDAALIADFRASSLALADGAAVSSWAPAAGAQTAPLAQATAGMQPVYNAATKTVQVTSDWMDTGAWGAPAPYSPPVTMLAVVEDNYPKGASPAPYWSGRSGVFLYAGPVANNDSVSFGAGATNEGFAKMPTGMRWHIICIVFNGASSRVYVDSLIAANVVTGTGVNAKLPGIKLAASSSATTSNAVFNIKRLAAISRALTDTEAKGAVQYLADLNGIPVTG